MVPLRIVFICVTVARGSAAAGVIVFGPGNLDGLTLLHDIHHGLEHRAEFWILLAFRPLVEWKVRGLDRSRHHQETSDLLGCDRYGEPDITHGTYSD